MQEPIIPSGHEFDAGLAPGHKREKRGLLGRIADKVKKGRRSKVHEFDLRLDSTVGARQAPPRVRPQPPAWNDTTTGEPTRADPVRSLPEQPKAAQSQRTQQAAPFATPRTKTSPSKPQIAPSIENLLEAQVPGGALGVGAWLLIANPDECSDSAAQYLEHLASTSEDKTVASVVRWRLSAAAGRDRAASRTLTLAAAESADLPADIAKVLRFLADNPMSLAKYRGDLGLAEGKASALRQLHLFCRSYPSAQPILVALEAGDTATALKAVNLTSASWHYGMSIINAAVAAVNGVPTTGHMPTCSIPRSWLQGSREQRCTAAALSSIVADDERSRLRQRFEPEFATAIGLMEEKDRAQAAAWLAARGVSLVEGTQPQKATAQPRKRLKVKMPVASFSPVAQQPTQAHQTRQQTVDRPRCSRCGVGEPARSGGICSSCAHGGD